MCVEHEHTHTQRATERVSDAKFTVFRFENDVNWRGKLIFGHIYAHFTCLECIKFKLMAQSRSLLAALFLPQVFRFFFHFFLLFFSVLSFLIAHSYQSNSLNHIKLLILQPYLSLVVAVDFFAFSLAFVPSTRFICARYVDAYNFVVW